MNLNCQAVTALSSVVTSSVGCLVLQVLKWSKNLPGARLTFQREWMLGRRLNAAARQDPDLDLLLQTGGCLASCHWLLQCVSEVRYDQLSNTGYWDLCWQHWGLKKA